MVRTPEGGGGQPEITNGGRSMTVARFAGFAGDARRVHGVGGLARGFIPSPPSGVGMFGHRYHGFATPRVRGLTRGFMPPPPSGVGMLGHCYHGFATPRVRGLTRGF